MLPGSRTLIGLAIGADSAIATSYIAEFAPRSRRGQLSIIQQWMITVGILVSYLVALLILKAAPGSAGGLDWRLILGIGAIPALVADELAEVEQARRRKTAWSAGVRRALIVVCVFFIFQQISGITVPFYYGPTLLGSSFGGGTSTAVSTATAGVEVTAILGAVNVIATYFAFRWIDKVGRRPLALWGYAGMTVFILIAAAGVGFLTGVPKTVLVMVGFSFFITSFAIGVGGTGWLIQGEVFPTAVRGRAAAIAACVDWLANYALIEAFPVWRNSIGLGWVMVCFAVLCVVAIRFVYRFLPETKELSVEQTVHVFERAADQSDATGSDLTGPPDVRPSQA